MQRPLRICMVSDDFLPAKTGVGVHTTMISRELARRGHTIVVITTRRPGQPAFEVWEGIRIHRTRSVRVADFYISIAGEGTIRELLEREAIEIVHTQYLGMLADRSSRVARALGIKQIYTFNTTIEHLLVSPVLKLFSRVIKARALRFFNRCDLITFPARRLRNEAIQDGVKAPSVYVSNATGIETKTDSMIEKRNDRFTVLFVGRLHPEKNVSYIIKAFAQLRASVHDGDLWIVGDGHLQGELLQEAKSLGVADNVKFVGRVHHDEVGQYYSQATVFVLPSWFETQGMVALEAMYYSLPVLVSRNLVSADDLVEEGQNGFLIDPASPSDLAAKLLLLYRDPERVRKMGTEGKQKFQQFRTDVIASTFEDLYFKMIQEG